MTTSKNAHLTIKLKKQLFRNSFKLTLIDLTNISILIDNLIFILFIVNNNVVFNINVFVVIEFVIIEMITSREIIIYNDDRTRCQLKKIIDQFSIL